MKGSLRWDLQQPNEILVGRRDDPNQVLQRATSGFSDDIAGFTDYPGGHPEAYPDGLKNFLLRVYSHIAGKEKAGNFSTFQDGHDELAICEAILASSRSNKWVSVKY